MFVEGGDHFIFMKEINILSHEQLSLLGALEKREKSKSEGEESWKSFLPNNFVCVQT